MVFLPYMIVPHMEEPTCIGVVSKDHLFFLVLQRLVQGRRQGHDMLSEFFCIMEYHALNKSKVLALMKSHLGNSFRKTFFREDTKCTFLHVKQFDDICTP